MKENVLVRVYGLKRTFLSHRLYTKNISSENGQQPPPPPSCRLKLRRISPPAVLYRQAGSAVYCIADRAKKGVSIEDDREVLLSILRGYILWWKQTLSSPALHLSVHRTCRSFS